MSKPSVKLRPVCMPVAVDAVIDAEVDPGDLHDAGWHHKSECASYVPVDVAAALDSLHRQAHPGQNRDVALCHEEPCRSLTLAQLRQVAP